MRGLLITDVDKMEICQFPDPVPGPGQVVVDIKCTSICGSDLHNLYNPNLPRDKIMGHEGAGVVAEVGEGVVLVKPGDRVAIYHVISCGKCRNCMAGYAQFCTVDRRAIAGIEHGTDADKILVKEANCLPLPDDISYAVGAFIGCFAGTSYSAIKKLAASGLDDVAVFGLGPVGLAGVQYAYAMGANVIGIDCIPERLALARELGCSAVINFKEQDIVPTLKKMTGGAGPRLIYESSGSLRAQGDALAACAPMGKICMVGFGSLKQPEAGGSPALYSMISKELTLMGSSIMPRQYHYEIIDFIRKKDIDLEKMITHRFPFEQIIEAMRLFATGATGKVVIDM